MSVLAISEIYDGRSGTKQLEKFQRKYSRVFLVETSTSADNASVVLAASPVAIGASYPGDTNCLCKSLSARQREKYTLWELQCDYDSDMKTDPTTQNENPTLRVPSWRVSFEKYKQAVKEDLDGEAVVNTVGDPFLPPVEIDKTSIKLQYETNIANFDIVTANSYVDKINDADWFPPLCPAGFLKWSVKCDSIDCSTMFENNVSFWKITFNFSVKMVKRDGVWVGGWHPIYVVNEGYYQYGISALAGKKIAIRDAQGVVKTTPTLLTQDGHVLPKEDEEGDPVPPVYIPFKLYESINFSAIA